LPKIRSIPLCIPLLEVDTLDTSSVGLDSVGIVSPDGSSDNSFEGQKNSAEFNELFGRISTVSTTDGAFLRERKQPKNFRKVYLILPDG